jgi:hypothetical protein
LYLVVANKNWRSSSNVCVSPVCCKRPIGGEHLRWCTKMAILENACCRHPPAATSRSTRLFHPFGPSPQCETLSGCKVNCRGRLYQFCHSPDPAELCRCLRLAGLSDRFQALPLPATSARRSPRRRRHHRSRRRSSSGVQHRWLCSLRLPRFLPLDTSLSYLPAIKM